VYRKIPKHPKRSLNIPENPKTSLKIQKIPERGKFPQGKQRSRKVTEFKKLGALPGNESAIYLCGKVITFRSASSVTERRKCLSCL
jgi:hypothetical protein